MQRTLIASLDKNNLDKEVSVSGWVENIRDHGGVIFIDLREGLDIFQIVMEPQNKEIFSIAETIRNEYVIFYRTIANLPINESILLSSIDWTWYIYSPGPVS